MNERGITRNREDRSTSFITVHIDELVLHGFPHGHHHDIGETVRQELTRLFAVQNTPATLAKNGDIGTINAGSIYLKPQSRPAAMGNQVARAVFKGLRQPVALKNKIL